MSPHAPMARQLGSQGSTTMTARLAAMRRPSRVRQDDAVLEHRWTDFRRVFGAGLQPPTTSESAGASGSRGEAPLPPRLVLAAQAGWSGGGHPLPLELLPELEVLTSRPSDERSKSELATIVLGLRYFAPCLDVKADDMTVLARAVRWCSCAPGEHAVEEHEIDSCLLLQLSGCAHLVLKQRPAAGLVRPSRQSRGSVQLERTPTTPPVTAVLPLGPGGSVGDLPHGRWRATGVVACSAAPNTDASQPQPSASGPGAPACFLVVRWSDFFAASMVERDRAAVRRVRLMRRIPVLQDFGDDALALLAACMTDHKAKRGEVVVRQGDEAQRFYILTSGEMEEIRTMAGGREGVRRDAAPAAAAGGVDTAPSAAARLAQEADTSRRPPPTLITGRIRGPAYFGERACFVVGEAYAKTVRAATSCDLSSISRADLTGLLSPSLLEMVREAAAQPSDDRHTLVEALVEEHWRGFKAALVRSVLADRDVRRWGAEVAEDPKQAVRELKPMHPRIHSQYHLQSGLAGRGVWAGDGFGTPVTKDAVTDLQSHAARQAYARRLLHAPGGSPVEQLIRRQLKTMPGGEEWTGNAALRRHAEREERAAGRVRGRGRQQLPALAQWCAGTSSVCCAPQSRMPHKSLRREAVERGVEACARSLGRPASRALLNRPSGGEATAAWDADALGDSTRRVTPRPHSAAIPEAAKPPRFVAVASSCSRPSSRAMSRSASVPAVSCRPARTHRGLSV
jgi:CRP-like cAMP-binding protein